MQITVTFIKTISEVEHVRNESSCQNVKDNESKFRCNINISSDEEFHDVSVFLVKQ